MMSTPEAITNPEAPKKMIGSVLIYEAESLEQCVSHILPTGLICFASSIDACHPSVFIFLSTPSICICVHVWMYYRVKEIVESDIYYTAGVVRPFSVLLAYQ